MMISTQKKQRQIFENFVTNLNTHSASWPKIKHQNSHHNVLIQTWNNPEKCDMHLQFLWIILIQYRTNQGLRTACTWKLNSLHRFAPWVEEHTKIMKKLSTNGLWRFLTRNKGREQKDSSPSSEGWIESQNSSDQYFPHVM
jgi:hypothetical protein